MRCLSLISSPDATERAKIIVQQLTEDPSTSSRLAVHVMHLDMLHADAPVQVDRVEQILNRIIRSTVLTDQTFKMYVELCEGQVAKLTAAVSCRPYIVRRSAACKSRAMF